MDIDSMKRTIGLYAIGGFCAGLLVDGLKKPNGLAGTPLLFNIALAVIPLVLLGLLVKKFLHARTWFRSDPSPGTMAAYGEPVAAVIIFVVIAGMFAFKW